MQCFPFFYIQSNRMLTILMSLNKTITESKDMKLNVIVVVKMMTHTCILADAQVRIRDSYCFIILFFFDNKNSIVLKRLILLYTTVKIKEKITICIFSIIMLAIWIINNFQSLTS